MRRALIVLGEMLALTLLMATVLYGLPLFVIAFGGSAP